MLAIPGYQVIEELYKSSESLVCRGLRDSDRMPVILKVLQPNDPSPEAIARFRCEYNIARTLDLAGVVKVYSLETHQHSLVLAMEDFGGESLNRVWVKQTPSLAEFLNLAIQITQALGQIHQKNIIHKDINPSNIVLNPITRQVKLIDFGIATVLPREKPTLQNPNRLEGTLAYLSPEQTGRMNRGIDYRTDFYSLGVTFYQLLADRLPFATTDALELVHCHLAKQPTPLCELKPQVPSVISDLVSKLLAKNAEDRYQSAWGIQADLQACLNHLRSEATIASFPLANQDITDHFQILEKLYGREREIEVLFTAFERMVGGAEVDSHAASSELILISGAAGVGKSALVQELYKPITRHPCYFIAGKFEPLERHTPYSALIQAFQAFTRQVLSESEAQISTWCAQLLEALGANGQVMLDVIPELEWIIGKQPPVPDLPSAEARNRFHLVFQKFIQVLAQPDHPLIVFLDDLQWGDQASLELVQSLLNLSGRLPLLWIGAYRDTEVDPEHPVMVMLDQMRKAGVRINTIALQCLDFNHVNAWVAETLQCDRHRPVEGDPAAIQPLAELIHQKTGGNPLFVSAFFRTLHQANLIYFDIHRKTWQWDLLEIQATQFTDNFLALIADKIQHLSPSAQQTLAWAACMGNKFEATTLAVICETSISDIAHDLWESVQADLISPVGSTYQYLHGDSLSATHPGMVSYQFLHDRIQKVAYDSLSELEQKQVHLLIGQQLLQELLPDQGQEKVFEIVNHLDLGRELITDQGRRDELARLNLIAGNKAKASIAYEPAFSYLTTGIALLDKDHCWSHHYELTLELYSATAEAAYLSGRIKQMEQLMAVAWEWAKTPLDRLPLYRVKIQALIAQNRSAEAIATALQALEPLEVKLPPRPTQCDIWLGTLRTKLTLAGKHTSDLIHLPRMSDPLKLAAMQVIASVCTPTYFTKPQLWQMMVFQKVQLSLKYGNAPGSPFGYADYGMVLCGSEGNFEQGYQFAQLAGTLLPQLQAREFVPKTLLLINIYLRHWREHLRTTLNPLVEAYERGLETGDLEYATFAIAFHSYHSYLVGRELTQLEQEMATYGAAIAQFQQVVPLFMNQVYRQAVLNLMGRSPDPCQLVGESYNEVERLPQLQADQDHYALFQIHLNKLILHYLFADYPQAVEQAMAAEQLLLAGATGMLVVPVFYFYSSLAQLAHFPQVAKAQQRRILKKVSKNQKKIKAWANQAPMNYLHQYHLVEAERCRILGESAGAMEHYDHAIALAKQHDYLQEEALANELAAAFYLQNDKIKFTQLYLQEARYCYGRWGATAKVKDLETRYSPRLDLQPRGAEMLSRRALSTSLTTTGSTQTNTFDLAAVMRAAQVLSSEIVLERLLDKLMKLLLENAGADKGCLILETGGKLLIEAEGSVNSGPTRILHAIPLENSDAINHVSPAIVHYVAHTHESLVLGNATQNSKFANDPYLLNHQPQSVLCAPLVNQGKLTGIVYLENSLTTDVFTSDRVEVIQLLSTQAAIAIGNARLYDQLELRVQERTIELTQMNQQLEQLTTELQRSNQELEQFAYIASHDLQEPLRAITSYTQKLAQRYQGQLDEKADLYIGFAVDGATRMQQLIQALLTYSRVGRQTLKLEPTDCNGVVNKVLRDLRVAITENQGIITVTPLPILEVDPTQLSLLFQNLIGNALKYHSEAAPQIHISAVEQGQNAKYWRFSVRDNGIGIEPQYAERIFTIFQRLHTSDEYPGTGLGLAISKKIVENHGGQIGVESKFGQGSTFYFELPAIPS